MAEVRDPAFLTSGALTSETTQFLLHAPRNGYFAFGVFGAARDRG